MHARSAWRHVLLGGIAVAWFQAAGIASPQQSPAVATTRRNTYYFDHAALVGRDPDPAVLDVRDGDYFQVVIENTDPRKFTYRINALQTDDALEASGSSAGAQHIATNKSDLRTTSVTMQHRKIIGKYRVHIALRPDLVEQPAAPEVSGAPPTPPSPQGARSRGRGGRPSTPPTATTGPAAGQVELYSVDFDVWVRTRDNWTTAFTSGVAFSGLTDRHFYVETDTKGNTDPADDTKIFREDTGARDVFKPELVALVNLSNPSWHNLGVLFGMGLNNSADPRYMVGGSYYLGRQFVLTGGLIGGKVRVTPTGQALDAPPINDNVAATVTTRFAHSWFFGIGFEFSDRKQFIQDYFASGTAASGTPPPAAALAKEAIAGTYTGTRGNATVTWNVAFQDDTLTIKDGSTVVFTSTARDGDTFTSGSNRTAVFRQEGDTVVLTYTQGTDAEITLKKKPQ